MLYETRPFLLSSYAELRRFAPSISVHSMRNIRRLYLFWDVDPLKLDANISSLGSRPDSILLHMEGLRELKIHLQYNKYLDCRHSRAWKLADRYNETRKMKIEIFVPIRWREGCQHRPYHNGTILYGSLGPNRTQQLQDAFAWLESSSLMGEAFRSYPLLREYARQ